MTQTNFANPKRYIVQAKRNSTYEKWSPWTEVDDYAKVLKQCKVIEKLGHWSKIIDREKDVVIINAEKGERYGAIH